MVKRYAHVAPEGLQTAANRLDSLMQACGGSMVIFALIEVQNDWQRIA